MAAAELWAIRDVLSLAWDMGSRKIILESDARAFLTLLHSTNAASVLTLLLDMCRRLLNRTWEINRVADCPFKSARSQDQLILLLDMVPSDVQHLLVFDVLGRSAPRRLHAA